ncbi:MAG: hypothetical protein M3337_00725 [Actinomycetota bacterium]|nr:hypothetical protein [Actinomycetota bacterium]
MRVGQSAGWVAAGAIAAVTATACRDPDESAGVERVVDTYEVTLRSVVRDDPTPSPPASSPGGRRPVVYAVGLDGDAIGTGIQADVVKRVVDDIDLRFADDREEAFDEDDAVHDDGVLIELGPVPDDGDRFEIEVVWYSTTGERRELAMNFRVEDAEVTVTGTSVLD